MSEILKAAIIIIGGFFAFMIIMQLLLGADMTTSGELSLLDKLCHHAWYRISKKYKAKIDAEIRIFGKPRDFLTKDDLRGKNKYGEIERNHSDFQSRIY